MCWINFETSKKSSFITQLTRWHRLHIWRGIRCKRWWWWLHYGHLIIVIRVLLIWHIRIIAAVCTRIRIHLRLSTHIKIICWRRWWYWWWWSRTFLPSVFVAWGWTISSIFEAIIGFTATSSASVTISCRWSSIGWGTFAPVVVICVGTIVSTIGKSIFSRSIFGFISYFHMLEKLCFCYLLRLSGL